MVQRTAVHGDRCYFAELLKQLRRRIIGKQTCLSRALGCTDAAVSLRESGRRLPKQSTLARIVDVLARSGASAIDLDDLQSRWQATKLTQQSGTPQEGARPAPLRSAALNR